MRESHFTGGGVYSVVVSTLASINVVNRYTLAPVSTWLGDCLRAGKPSGYV